MATANWNRQVRRKIWGRIRLTGNDIACKPSLVRGCLAILVVVSPAVCSAQGFDCSALEGQWTKLVVSHDPASVNSGAYFEVISVYGRYCAEALRDRKSECSVNDPIVRLFNAMLAYRDRTARKGELASLLADPSFPLDALWELDVAIHRNERAQELWYTVSDETAGFEVIHLAMDELGASKNFEQLTVRLLENADGENAEEFDVKLWETLASHPENVLRAESLLINPRFIHEIRHHGVITSDELSKARNALEEVRGTSTSTTIKKRAEILLQLIDSPPPSQHPERN